MSFFVGWWANPRDRNGSLKVRTSMLLCSLLQSCTEEATGYLLPLLRVMRQQLFAVQALVMKKKGPSQRQGCSHCPSWQGQLSDRSSKLSRRQLQCCSSWKLRMQLLLLAVMMTQKLMTHLRGAMAIVADSLLERAQAFAKWCTFLLARCACCALQKTCHCCLTAHSALHCKTELHKYGDIAYIFELCTNTVIAEHK